MFFLVITPVGLVRRIFTRDSFGKTPRPDMTTYWVAVGPDGPADRPEKPF